MRVRAAWAVLGVTVLLLCAARADEPATLPPEERLPLPDLKLPAGKVSEEWVHAGGTSAIVYWQTANRSRSYVEYGLTDAYGQRTVLSPESWVVARPYYTQFHRLMGLEGAREYHYRLVSIGTNGEESRSGDRTFRTSAPEGAIALPGDLAGPPYVLDKPGATYVVTKDLVVPLAGIEIRAGGVTLDFDGHTLTYNDAPAKFPDDKWTTRLNGATACWGVFVNASVKEPVRILNGRIVQGKGNDAGSAVGIGCNPLYAGGPPDLTEISGMEFIWSGRDVSGLYLHWGFGAHVHHCVMEDRGTEITNRHQAISVIDGNGGGDYDHVLVKATRQQGLCGARKCYYSEVYINSYDTNSFGIAASPQGGPVDIAWNRVFGSGNHPIAFGMFGVFLRESQLHHNYAEVMCTRKGKEYGWTGSACFRTTWGADGFEVFQNTFIGYSLTRERGGIGSVGHTRVLWVGLPFFTPKDAPRELRDARAVFRDNVLIARGLDDTAKAAAIAVVCHNQSPNLMFVNNTVVSTWGNVLLSDDYGDSDGHPKFIGNVFRREGKSPSYATIRSDYGGRPATAVFLENRFEGDASPESVKADKGMKVVFQKLVTIALRDPDGSPAAGAEVIITDRRGEEVLRDRTATRRTTMTLVSVAGPALVLRPDVPREDTGYVREVTSEPGQMAVLLTEASLRDAERDVRAPHTVTVRFGDRTVTRQIPAGATGLFEIRL